MTWKNIKIDQVQIEKCIGEFEITALDFFEELFEGDVIHFGAFKVKIYETQTVQFDSNDNYNFIGYTNLKVKSPFGNEGGIGYGHSLEQALEQTIKDFMNKLLEFKNEKKSGLEKKDIILVDYDEF